MDNSLSFVCVGHVDHGKSSLIGRLLVDTKTIPEDAVRKVQRICEERGKRFEYAFLLDAFAEERDQGITIETMKIEFSTDKRSYTIIDAPGHKEFLKNMATGASHAQAALLLVDAKQGMQEQTRKHAYVLGLLGITQVSVVINKMDLVGYDEERFEEISADVREYLAEIGINPSHIIPLSAMQGDNILARSKNMPWYDSQTLVEAIDSFTQESADQHLPLRMPLQDIYKFDERRILAGKIESGSLQEGEDITFWPSGKTAKVKSIETWPKIDKKRSCAGESVGITIDEEFFLKRGECIVHPGNKPEISTMISVTVFWMGAKPLEMNTRYSLRINTQEVDCQIHTIERVIDAETLTGSKSKHHVQRYEVARVILHTEEPVVFDAHNTNAPMGRFVLVHDTDVVGGGIISEGPKHLAHRQSLHPRSMLISPKEHNVALADRVTRNGHRPLVIWISGLAGSAKNEVANSLEQALFDQGIATYYLDSSDVRMTLSSDLSFSKKQRSEHTRRVAELANVLRSAGHVVIVSIISPFRADRKQARRIVGEDAYMEVFIDTPLEVCERNNPHGIYERARSGEISGVPGIDIEYERSEDASVYETDGSQVRDIIDRIMQEALSRVR